MVIFILVIYAMVILLLIWLLVLFISLILYIKKTYSRFSDNGVKYVGPLHLLWNVIKIFFQSEHLAYANDKTYNVFSGERFVATNSFLKPTLMIRDLELIKKIAIKDFEHFLDHQHVIDDDAEPFIARTLFALKGQEWKDMRSTLSPAFTSSKIRLMVAFISEISDQTVFSLKNQILSTGTHYIDIDCKDLITRHTVDVIASCAFGYKVNTHVDRDNEFYEMGNYITSFTFMKMVRFLAWMVVPAVTKKFKVGILSKRARTFFKHLVLDAITNRNMHNIKRDDMINIIMEAKAGKLQYDEKCNTGTDAGYAVVEESGVGKKKVNKVWSDDDFIAQALLFFLAGFETVSSTIIFLLFELAQNPDIQDKLAKEIREDYKKNDGKLDYSSLQHLKYLDMVISEVLRLWTPASMSDRTCTKNYNLGKPNKECIQDYIIRPGDGIFIPIWSIHHSAEYFANPDKFDPERFSEKNRHEIKPFTYMPFGLGPRNCIGSRFALCEVKIMMYKLILNVEVTPCEKTRLPMELSPENLHPRIKGGHWLRFKIRE